MESWWQQFAPPRNLSADGRLLFASRFVRLFSYGFLSVVLVLYLAALGFSDSRIGLLLSLTLVGDIVISLLLTTSADRFGRRRTLVVSAARMLAAGLVFAFTHDFYLLLAAATIGVISPSGNEVGPFLSVEQAALSQIVPEDNRTHVFGWYNLIGSLATALGALASGTLVSALQRSGYSLVQADRVVLVAYAAAGIVLAVLAMFLKHNVELPAQARPSAQAGAKAFMGLHRSKKTVAKLSGLFVIDAFGGGFVIQSILAYWFYKRWNLSPGMLGTIFFGANILAAISALTATLIARRIGLIRTMVFTHLPSNVLLILVPLMPTPALAVLMLLLRFSISQMDVPTRQAYVMAVVDPDERSAAAGVTAVARSIGASVSPGLSTALLGTTTLLGLSTMALPFFLGGGLKIVYDLLLYRSFVKSQPAENRE